MRCAGSRPGRGPGPWSRCDSDRPDPAMAWPAPARADPVPCRATAWVLRATRHTQVVAATKAATRSAPPTGPRECTCICHDLLRLTCTTAHVAAGSASIVRSRDPFHRRALVSRASSIPDGSVAGRRATLPSRAVTVCRLTRRHAGAWSARRHPVRGARGSSGRDRPLLRELRASATSFAGPNDINEPRPISGVPYSTWMFSIVLR